MKIKSFFIDSGLFCLILGLINYFSGIYEIDVMVLIFGGISNILIGLIIFITFELKTTQKEQTKEGSGDKG